MFRFENPDILYLLAIIPVLAVLYYFSTWRKRHRLRQYGDMELLQGLMVDVSVWRPQFKLWLALLALACIIIAFARPQYGSKIDNVERKGIEAIIAIDVSNSMLAEDVRPSRMEKAKMLFSNMVDEMKDDQVGIVVFAGDAFVQLPITNDYVSAKMFLDQIDPSMIRQQGTDIAAALKLARQSFTQRKNVSRAIFVITDGEDNEGGAVEAAKEAKEKGIHVFMLGVGSPEGAHIPIPGTAQYIIDEEGNPVVSRLNEEMCQQIARAGEGAYIYVDNSTSAQSSLQKYVDKLAKSNLESNIYSEYDEQFQGFLLIALLLLIIDVLLLERKTHLLKSLKSFGRASMLLLLLFLSVGLQAQNHRDYVRRGNRFFRDSIYDKAQVEYQKGFQKDSLDVPVQYNLANTLLRQSQPKEAMRLLERAAKAERSPLRRAKIFHNMGLILQSQKQYGPAIQSYMESLRNNPRDNETRYNLVLCQRQLKNNPDSQDKKDDKKDDKDKKEQDKQQQQKQNQPKQDEEKRDNTQQQKPKQNEMNKENAEQMLNAALQNERRTQDKVKQQQIRGGQRRLKKQW